jgi:DNA-binding transcriptional ArsR family regulator
MEMTLHVMADQLAGLAQPQRLAVFRLLVVAGPAGRLPGDIAAELAIPPSSLSFHLAHLRRAGLVRVETRGRERRYVADFGAMRGLVDFLTENCCAGADCAPAAETPEAIAPNSERNVA